MKQFNKYVYILRYTVYAFVNLHFYILHVQGVDKIYTLLRYLQIQYSHYKTSHSQKMI